jgi:DNA polymerase III subunit epsilon
LVAHNAPFDLGFLRAACVQLGTGWPRFDAVDTARLARRVLTRDEAPDCRLATLSRLFRTRVQPCHRAFADAEATVDVLHGLLARVGGLGVHSLAELQAFSAAVSAEQRRKRHLAEPLPHRPGVYLFRDARGRVLYVGKSTDLRTRVRSYFVASEPRTRMAEMVGLAERVDHYVCAHNLEAEIRELRLIAEHKPRYNRRSRWPERGSYLKLTLEPYPRLSRVRTVLADGATYLGPFGSARSAELALVALHDAVPLRQCTTRLSRRRRTAACVLAELDRCGAPCDGRQDEAAYGALVAAVRQAITADPRTVVATLQVRIDALAAAERFEDAAAVRDRLGTFLRAAARLQRLTALARCPLLVGARPGAAGGWEVSVIKHGRLVSAGVAPPGAAPRPYVDALVAAAESVDLRPGPTPCATAEEMECVLRWLTMPGSRLVLLEGTWSSPAYGAEGLRRWLQAAEAGRELARPLEDRRRLRPLHQPARSGPPDAATRVAAASFGRTGSRL